MVGKRMRNVSVASSSSYSNSDESIDNYSIDNGLGDSAGSSTGSSTGSSIRLTKKVARGGRVPSKNPCPNRNAAVARANRQKKKEYIEDLENSLANSEKKNHKINNLVAKQGIEIKRLSAEVSYLKTILKNKSSIASLLKSMNSALFQKNNNNNNNNNDTSTDQQAPVKLNKGSMVLDNSTISSFDKTDENYIFTPANIFDVEGISRPSDTNTSSFEADNSPVYQTDPELDIEVNDNLHDPSNNYESNMLDSNLFDNLEQSGVCLHVSSGKISLEYCSVCHLNSINSDDNYL